MLSLARLRWTGSALLVWIAAACAGETQPISTDGTVGEVQVNPTDVTLALQCGDAGPMTADFLHGSGGASSLTVEEDLRAFLDRAYLTYPPVPNVLAVSDSDRVRSDGWSIRTGDNTLVEVQLILDGKVVAVYGFAGSDRSGYRMMSQEWCRDQDARFERRSSDATSKDTVDATE